MKFTQAFNGQRVLWIALAYVALALPGYVLQISPTYGSLIFPGSGLALAAIILYRSNGLLGVGLGSILLQIFLNYFFELRSQHQPWLYVLIAGGSVLQAYAGGWWYDWWFGRGKRRAMYRMESITDAVCFLTWAGLCTTLISATIANCALLAYGLLDQVDFFYNWMHWYVGDAFGVLVCYPIIMCFLKPNDPLWNHRRRQILMPTIGLWILLFLLLAAFKKWEVQQQNNKLAQDGQALLETISTEVDTQNEALYALAGFIEATPTLSFEHFEKFATTTLARHPEVAGLSFNHRVSAAARAAFEREASRLSPLGNYQITERDDNKQLVVAAMRPEYVAVKFIAPLLPNQAAVGFDILSEPNRKAAVQQVLASGDIVSTVPLKLVQDNRAYTGVLRLVPLHEGRQDMTLRTPGVTGFAVAVLKVDQLMQQAIGHLIPEGLRVELRDSDESIQNRTLYSSDGDAQISSRVANFQPWEASLDVGQRRWSLVVTPVKVSYFHQNDWLVGSIVALMCAILCILVQAFLMDMTVRGFGTDQKLQQVLQTLRDMVGRFFNSRWNSDSYADLPSLARYIAELQHNEEVHRKELTQQKNALDQHNIVSILNARGRITYVNQKLCDFLGYRPEELLGQRHRVTASGVHSVAFFRALLRQVRRGQAWQGEICEAHKDGATYWGYTTVLPFMGGRGKPERYIVIRTDITPLKNAEVRLEHANRAKNAFLSTMSHEIRTPLNALLGTAQVLEKTHLDSEQADMVHDIVKSGGLLLSQLNDILDFSKIESGHLSVDCLPFSLCDVLERVESLMGAAAKVKGLNFQIDVVEQPPRFLLGDSMRLTQVLLNLCSNAIKFTAAGQVSITIHTVALANERVRVHFAVTDTGIGITEEQQHKLFEPFVQADSSVTRNFGGTGLGLSICKRLVELMGGEIGLTSALEHGTTFWFELEYALDAQTAPMRCVSERSVGPMELGHAHLPQRHILVVDDNEMNRKMLQRLLQQEGARVTLAEDGQAALTIIAAQPQAFDAVLMDVQMPVMDGLTAIRHIREELQLPALSVLACSAGVYRQDLVNATNAGANGFVAKPINREELLAALAQSMPVEPVQPVVIKEEKAAVLLPVQPEIQDTWPTVEGLDIALLRDQFGDDWEFATTLLHMFIQELERILQALSDEQWPLDDPEHAWGQRLHKLRGAAGTVGAAALVALTQELEDALKAGDAQAQLTQRWPVFVACCQQVLAGVRAVL